jgi:hypothetical protein
MYAHDANVACLLTLEGGLEVSYLGTWAGGWDELRFEWRTDCADGVIVQRELFADLATARTRDTVLIPVPLPGRAPFTTTRGRSSTPSSPPSALGREPPCAGRDHLRSLALCFAAIEASETGRRVMMRDFHTHHGLEDLT